MGWRDGREARAASASGNRGGYDRVHVAGTDGQVRSLSQAQFEGLPLQDRIQILVKGGARFFRDDQEITSLEALKSRD